MLELVGQNHLCFIIKSRFPCRYCYLGCCDINPDIALHILSAAGKYMLPLLEEACRKILIENLCPETIWEVYTYSITFAEQQLCEGCREFFRKKVKPIEKALLSPAFLTIPYEVLLDLLQINDSNISQPWDVQKLGILISDKELFLACHTWAVAECSRQELEVSGANKQKVLKDCFPLIRFPCMLKKDIVNVVSPTEILKEDQKASLFQPSTKLLKQIFLSTKQHVPVETKPEMRLRLENNLMRTPRGPLQSTLVLKPHKRLALSQIWVLPRYHEKFIIGHQCIKFEVVIKAKNGIRNRQSVVCQVIGGVLYQNMSFLDLEPVVLDSDCKYTIEVYDKRQEDCNPQVKWSEEERLRLTLEEKRRICSKIRLPADVGLKITNKKSNPWISALTVRLV